MKLNTRLKYTVATNSIFTLTSSLSFILFSSDLAQIFYVEAFIIESIGFGLLLFLLQLLMFLRNKNRWIKIQWIIFQDLAWVVSSLILVVWNPMDFSILAQLIIISIALIVMLFAVLQWRYSRY